MSAACSRTWRPSARRAFAADSVTGQAAAERALHGSLGALFAVVIRYRTNRQIGFFPNYDELYWNATGTGWTFAIDEAEARITLPEPVRFLQAAFYTGPQGAQGRDAMVAEQQPGRIVFRTTRPLPPKN